MSHPAVLPVNQLVYAELNRRGFRVELVVPARWHHEYADRPFGAVPLPELADSFHPSRVWLAGQPQRHLYLTIRKPRSGDVALLWSSANRSRSRCPPPSGAWQRMLLACRSVFVQMDENLDRPLPGQARLIRAAILPRAAVIAARSDTAAVPARSWGARGDVRLIPHHVPGWPRPACHPHDCFTVGYAGRLVPEKGDSRHSWRPYSVSSYLLGRSAAG